MPRLLQLMQSYESTSKEAPTQILLVPGYFMLITDNTAEHYLFRKDKSDSRDNNNKAWETYRYNKETVSS